MKKLINLLNIVIVIFKNIKPSKTNRNLKVKNHGNQ